MMVTAVQTCEFGSKGSADQVLQQAEILDNMQRMNLVQVMVDMSPDPEQVLGCS